MMLNRLVGATVVVFPKREGVTHDEEAIRVQRVMESEVKKMRSVFSGHVHS